MTNFMNLLYILMVFGRVNAFYTWYNWQFDMTCKATGLYVPGNETQLQIWLAQKYRIGALIKVVGHSHVFGNITTCVSYDETHRNESWIVKMANFADLSVDETGLTATFGAGWTLNDLVVELGKRDLTVINTGTERVQNFVGAFTTGTHGTGKDLGIMAVPVKSMRLLTADGGLLIIDENSPYYNARLTLGVLGIITQVTIELQQVTYLKRIDIGMDSSNLKEFYAEIWTMSRTYPRIQIKDLDFTYDNDVKRWIHDNVSRVTYWESTTIEDVNNCTTIALCCGDCYPSICYDREYNAIAAPQQGHECGPKFFAEFEHIFPFTTTSATELIDFVFNYTEYFNTIDMSRIIEIFEGFDGALNKPCGGLKLRMPEFRFVKADNIWMSEANNYNLPDVTDFGIINIDLKMPFSNFETLAIYFDFLNTFIPKFGTEYNIRPHWGKYSNFSFDYTQIVYPKVGEFLALRKITDPHCQFANKFLIQHLGLETDSYCGIIFDLSVNFTTLPAVDVIANETNGTECCVCNGDEDETSDAKYIGDYFINPIYILFVMGVCLGGIIDSLPIV